MTGKQQRYQSTVERVDAIREDLQTAPSDALGRVIPALRWDLVTTYGGRKLWR